MMREDLSNKIENFKMEDTYITIYIVITMIALCLPIQIIVVLNRCSPFHHLLKMINLNIYQIHYKVYPVFEFKEG